MKIFKYGLPLAALAMLASCSNDNVSVPEDNATTKGGDMFFSVNISHPKTRTATESPYYEVGQDYENKISDALIIFTRDVTSVETVFAVYHLSGNQVDSYESNTTATWEVSRSEFLKDITDNSVSTYNLYVVANPTTDMVAEYVKKVKIQDQFEDLNDAGTYWNNNKFLMSNSDAYSTTKITSTEIAEGKHTTEATALELGTIKVQRAMSRFDLPKYYSEGTTVSDAWKFSTSNPKSSLKNVTLTFDAVALFNQATKANVFKVTADDNTGWASPWTLINFDDETEDNWVLTPDQTSYSLSLFNSGAQKNLSSLDYTEIKDLSTADNTIKDSSNENNDADQQGNYYIWRYAMENTNYGEDADDVAAQKKGVTTGVVFRAKMTFGEEGTDVKPTGSEDNADIYAFGNVILGDLKSLYKYVSNDKPEDDNLGVYEVVCARWEAALNEYNEKNSSSKLEPSDASTNAQLAVLKDYLKAREFTIYTYDTQDNGYYCYYVYYNRHNDNDKATIMGIMEFSTVRNNVYKLSVNSISKLGHPADPSGDPDPEDPDDPSEEDHLFFSVNVEVLPWVVRFNGIDF